MVGGTLCVTLGVIGVFVPVLPTTPFLLLAAICYARSSDRLYDWLLTNRWFGDYVRHYREDKGLPLNQKIITLTALWLTLGYAALFAVSQFWAQIILFGIALTVTIHLLRVKTFKPVPPEIRTAGPAMVDSPLSKNSSAIKCERH